MNRHNDELNYNFEEIIRNLLRELANCASSGDIPRGIQLCEKGLRIVHRNNNPEVWAALQFWLGTFLIGMLLLRGVAKS